MHPALAVGPTEQGTRIGLGRMTEGKQGYQAKLPETVSRNALPPALTESFMVGTLTCKLHEGGHEY